MEENEKESTERRQQAKRERQEDATGCSTEENIIAEQEDLVSVIVRSSDGALIDIHGEAHLGVFFGF